MFADAIFSLASCSILSKKFILSLSIYSTRILFFFGKINKTLEESVSEEMMMKNISSGILFRFTVRLKAEMLHNEEYKYPRES